MLSDKEPQDKNTEDSVEERVVQKLKKVITIKKQLSEKQQAHIDKLAKGKAGKKYVEKIEAKDIDIELPTEIVTKKPRAPRVKPVEPESESESEPDVIVVKKKKKKRVEVIEETETESEEEVKPIKKKVVKKAPAVVVKAKAPVKKAPVKKAPVKKAPVKKVVIVEPIVEPKKSRFSKNIF